MASSTLNFYIGRRFLLVIMAAFFFCSFLIFVIDLVELLRQTGKKGSVPGWQLAWIALLRLPAYTEFLLAFAVLVGSIGTLLMLARKSELAVIRASGMSVWGFLMPGVMVVLALGVISVLVYNPLAAGARAKADRLSAKFFSRETNLLEAGSAGSWLRQDGPDGQSVLTATRVARRGTELFSVTAFVYDHDGHFRERVDAERGILSDGVWELKNARVARAGENPEAYGTYLLATYLTPERAADALGKAIAVSFWELPDLIEAAEKAGLSTARLQVQYELLLSRPLLCLAMLLLAATVSLKSFRSGGVQTMVLSGMVGGFGFLLMAEISRQIGMAGLVAPRVAVWTPVLIAILATSTVLLHQEDG